MGFSESCKVNWALDALILIRDRPSFVNFINYIVFFEEASSLVSLTRFISEYSFKNFRQSLLKAVYFRSYRFPGNMQFSYKFPP